MPRPQRRVSMLIVVGLLGAFAPFGVDLYLPALPDMAADLGATGGEAQLTIVGYLVGLGAAQLFWGPLSDRIGRRLPLLIGSAGFVLISILLVFAWNVWVLIALRVLQGAIGAAGVVVGRALIRDLYSGVALARIFSRLTIVGGMAPVLAPLGGAALLTFTDWRGTFVALAVIGAIVFAGTAFLVPETLDHEHRLHGRSAERSEAWRAVWRSGPFLRYGMALIAGNVLMFGYLTSISLILQGEWHFDTAAFSIAFAVNALGGILGGQLSGWLVRRIAPARLLPILNAIVLVGAIAVLVAGIGGGPLWLLQAGLFVTVAGFMASAGPSQALAIGPFSRGIGTAAAILGASQFFLGSLIPGVIGPVFGTTTPVLGIVMVVSAATALVVVIGSRARPSTEELPESGATPLV